MLQASTRCWGTLLHVDRVIALQNPREVKTTEGDRLCDAGAEDGADALRYDATHDAEAVDEFEIGAAARCPITTSSFQTLSGKGSADETHRHGAHRRHVARWKGRSVWRVCWAMFVCLPKPAP